MVLTNYYRFTRKACEKSKTRFECTASTGDYAPFEMCRCTRYSRPSSQRDEMICGTLYCYINNYALKYFMGVVSQIPTKSVTMKSRIVTEIIISSDKRYGYGEIRGTHDAIFFILNKVYTKGDTYTEGATIEMFISRGRQATRSRNFKSFQEGMLNRQIEKLRREAKQT